MWGVPSDCILHVQHMSGSMITDEKLRMPIYPPPPPLSPISHAVKFDPNPHGLEAITKATARG
jgi:hypothetical protein